jgi:hypothetical protein
MYPKQPPTTINPDEPDTGAIIDSQEVSKDDNLKLPGDDLDNKQDNNIAGSQVVKANLSAG